MTTGVVFVLFPMISVAILFFWIYLQRPGFRIGRFSWKLVDTNYINGHYYLKCTLICLNQCGFFNWCRLVAPGYLIDDNRKYN